ncbi:MAG TPA: tRNA (adenosine(37)-N6)-threonylcarbamoyltransferase complex ATPase subunit type 1 TsaE [Candidatus Saccharimonadales bacterium]|nr:tRNA (adenosine(37)-N6)-threonylcarbamoyltransferase complex ATPase subunit type 1 TsaE [Candidatus Saccharimonadales bacterium]
MQLTFICNTVEDTKALASKLGEVVRGGEVLAFHSDLGGGKTTFVKGLAAGMGVTGVVQSPTFTLSQIHKGTTLELHHYDFYRLSDAGVMGAELSESLDQEGTVVAVEWGEIVHDILPSNAVSVTIKNNPNDESRTIILEIPETFHYISYALQKYQQNEAKA